MKKFLFLFCLTISMLYKLNAQTAFNFHFDIDSFLNAGFTVCQTHDGGYLLVGSSSAITSSLDYSFFVRTDCNGAVIWREKINLSSTGDEYAYTIIQKNNGEFIISGGIRDTALFTKDGFLLCLDIKGNLKWLKKYGGSNDDFINEMKQCADGGYICAGYTCSNSLGPEDAWLFKTDSIGNLLWEKHFGGANWDKAYSVDLTKDGGYIIGGSTNSFGNGNNDLFLLKTDSLGNLQWQRTFGTINWDDGRAVRQTDDGGYVLVGEWDDPSDAVIIKTDSLGIQQWKKTFGYIAYDGFTNVEQLQDKNYIVSGYTEVGTSHTPKGWLVKLNQVGDSLWSRKFGISIGGEYIYGLTLTSDGGFVMAGQDNRQGPPYQDMWLIKTDSNGCDQSQCNHPCYACGYIEPAISVSSDSINLQYSDTIHFFDQSSFAQHRLWNFDNGTTDTVKNPLHTFNAVGTYHIKLIAYFNNCSDTAYHTVYVKNIIYTFNISGTLTYANSQGTPLSNVSLYLKQNNSVIDSIITSAYGSYLFNSKPTGTYTISAFTTKPWSNITATDALIIDRHVAGLSILTEPKLSAADVNQSSNITSADALLVKRRVVTLIDSFPSGDWYFNPQPVTVSNADVIMNFKGICFGDVNGSYFPANAKTFKNTLQNKQK